MQVSQETINSTLESAVKQLSLDIQEVHGVAKETLAQAKVTNGRVNKAETEISLIKERMENNKILADLRQKERDRMWAIAMVAIGSIIGLGSYIIYNL